MARRDGEDGTILIIVLAFLLVIGVLVIALLGFSFTATSASEVYRTDRVVRANAESALNVTVRKLTANPLMATDATSTGTPPLDPNCAMNFAMVQDLTTGAKSAFTTGSYLTVTCGPTTAFDAAGPYGGASGSGGTDTDGGQRPRDVTITITCHGGRSNVKTELTCGAPGSGTARIVARARVRFEVDTTVTDRTKRAVVPKIVTWDIKR